MPEKTWVLDDTIEGRRVVGLEFVKQRLRAQAMLKLRKRHRLDMSKVSEDYKRLVPVIEEGRKAKKPYSRKQPDLMVMKQELNMRLEDPKTGEVLAEFTLWVIPEGG